MILIFKNVSWFPHAAIPHGKKFKKTSSYKESRLLRGPRSKSWWVTWPIETKGEDSNRPYIFKGDLFAGGVLLFCKFEGGTCLMLLKFRLYHEQFVVFKEVVL